MASARLTSQLLSCCTESGLFMSWLFILLHPMLTNCLALSLVICPQTPPVYIWPFNVSLCQSLLKLSFRTFFLCLWNNITHPTHWIYFWKICGCFLIILIVICHQWGYLKRGNSQRGAPTCSAQWQHCWYKYLMHQRVTITWV